MEQERKQEILVKLWPSDLRFGIIEPRKILYTCESQKQTNGFISLMLTKLLAVR